MPPTGAQANEFAFDFVTDLSPSVIPSLPTTMSPATSLLLAGPLTESLQLDSGTAFSVQGYNWGVSQQAAVSGTVVEPGDFSVYLPSSKADGSLLLDGADGGTHATASLTVVANGFRIQWVLTNVIVSSFAASLDAGGGTDRLTLHFDTIQESVTPTNGTGAPDGTPVTGAWDFKIKQQPQQSLTPPKGTLPAPLVFPAGQVSASLQTDGLGTIAINSFSWGESLPIGPTGVGIAQPSDVVISLTAGAEAPLLLLDTADGEVVPQVVVTGQDNGQSIQWTLGNVTISSFTESYSTGGGSESVHFHYASISESVTVVTTKGATQTNPSGQNVEGASIVVNLTLPNTNPTLPAVNVNVPVDSFFWTESASGQGPATASDVTLTLQASPEVQMMLSAAVGQTLGQVVLTAQLNGEMVQFVLNSVSRSSFESGLGVGGIGDSYSLHFDSIQQSVTPVDDNGTATGKAVVAGWDFTTGQATPPRVIADTITTVTSTGLSQTFSSVPQIITLSASVGTAGTAVNEGTVASTILDAANNVVATLLGNPVADGIASANFDPAQPLPAGSYRIQAAYAPLPAYSNLAASSDTSDGTLTITPDSTTITVSTSVFLATQTTLYTQPATFTAAVLPAIASLGGEVDEGTVTFTILDAKNDPIVTLSGNSVIGGTASAVYDLAGLALGAYTVQATYVPGNNPDFTASASSNFCGFDVIAYPILNLLQTSSSTTVTSTNLTKTFPVAGQSVTLSAAVTNSGSGPVSEGTVTFTLLDADNNTVATLAGNPVTAGNASVVYILPGLAAGSYSIHAAYVPAASNPNFTSSADSSDGTLTVVPARTTTTVASTGLTSLYATADQTVTLDALVRSPGVSVNDGTVTFTFQDAHNNVVGSSVTSSSVSNGEASVTFTLPGNTPAGTYFIHASYTPAANDANFVASSDSGPGTLRVLADTTVLAIGTPSALTAFASASQTVHLSATVAPGNSTAGGTVNEGTVTFTVLDAHNQPLGSSVTSGTVANGTVSAVFTLPAHMTAGSYVIHATYNPAASAPNFLPGGDLLGDTVLRVLPGTSTAITSTGLSKTFSTTSDIVTLRASVLPGKGATTSVVKKGTVTFTIVDAGNHTVAILPGNAVVGGAASAHYDLAGLSAGNYHVHAAYVPTLTNSNFTASSDGKDATLVISRAPTRTTLTTTGLHRSYSTGSDVVAFSASVKPGSSASGSVNEGTVTFTVQDVHNRVIATLAGNAVSGGVASVRYDLAGLPVGKYHLHAVYVPRASNPDFTASTDLTGVFAITAAQVGTFQLVSTEVTPGLMSGRFVVRACFVSRMWGRFGTRPGKWRGANRPHEFLKRFPKLFRAEYQDHKRSRLRRPAALLVFRRGQEHPVRLRIQSHRFGPGLRLHVGHDVVFAHFLFDNAQRAIAVGAEGQSGAGVECRGVGALADG